MTRGNPRWRGLAGFVVLLVLLAAAARGQSDAIGLTPLTELGQGTYRTFQGGLYPNGENAPPAGHASAALARAAEIVPRDRFGRADEDGWIVLLSIGMSNTTQEFAVFERDEDQNADRNPRVVIINGAVGGQTASVIADPAAEYWGIVDQRLAAMGLSARQVQAAWVKSANAQPEDDFPAHAEQLRDDLAAVVHVLHDRFPELRLCYLSSRTYGGYARSALNPEPQAYESGFAVKWLIERQIEGDAALNFDGAAGRTEAPLLLWGPYLWADGVDARSDGLTWSVGDFENDGTHPSPSGEEKVASLLSAFFADEPSAGWFRDVGNDRLVAVAASADATVKERQPESNFGGEAELLVSGGRVEWSHLRFDVFASARPVALAKLSLRVVNAGGGEVRLVENAGWDESRITFSNAPVAGATASAEAPESSRGSTVSWDVTDVVNADADGVISLALTSDGETQLSYVSRESGDPPRLILVPGDAPTEEPSRPTIPACGAMMGAMVVMGAALRWGRTGVRWAYGGNPQ